MAALLAIQLSRKTHILSAFHALRTLSLQLALSRTFQKIERKTLSTSAMASKEVVGTEPPGSPGVQSSAGTSSSSDIHRRKVFIGNVLIHHADKNHQRNFESAIYDYFSNFGEIERMDLPQNRLRKTRSGFGFLTFREVDDAQSVLSHAQTHAIAGQTITVAPLNNKRMTVEQKRSLTLLVTNILNTTTKEDIEKHFSRFGKVTRVFLARKDSKNKDVSSYYVMFASLTGTQTALKQPVQRISEQNIDSKVENLPQIKDITFKTKRMVLTSIPDDLTVEDLKDYFQQYGEVEQVELLVNMQMMSPLDGHSNIAYVHLASAQVVDKIVGKENHVIKGSEVKVEKRRDLHTDLPDRFRQLKLAVRGVPVSNGKSIIKEYLEKTFNIEPLDVFFDRRQLFSKKESPCFVKFFEQEHLERVLKIPMATFKGYSLHFCQLVWRKKL